MDYVRFEVRRTGEGLFHAYEQPRVPRRCRRRHTELLNWLNCNTPVPPREAYDGSTGDRLTWWQPWAHEHIRHAQAMSDLLNGLGVRMRPIRAHAIEGEILFEDGVQVVVRHERTEIRRMRREPDKRDETRGWSGDRRTIRRMTRLNGTNASFVMGTSWVST